MKIFNWLCLLLLSAAPQQSNACELACDLGDGIFRIFAGDVMSDIDTVCVGDTLLFTWVNYEIMGRHNFTFDWSDLNNHLQVIGPTDQLVATAIVNKELNILWDYPTARMYYYYNNGTAYDSCVWEYPLYASYCDLPQSNFYALERRVCAGQCISYSAVADVRINQRHWFFEGGTPSTFIGENPPPICYEQSGKHDVMLVSLNSAGSDTLLRTDYVTILDAPLDVGSHSLINQDQGVALVLSPCVAATHYDWYQNDELLCSDCPFYEYIPYGDAQFRCIAYGDTLACAATCSYDVVVQNVKDKLLVPTAFSPNGDGINDVLSPVPYNVVLLSFAIYDRWGNLVYESHNDQAAWQGNYKGKDCEQGAYIYIAQYERLYDHSQQTQKGSIVLVR